VSGSPAKAKAPAAAKEEIKLVTPIKSNSAADSETLQKGLSIFRNNS